jgi:3-hydroxybutyryl-CoA dehydrogenase
MGPLELTDLIGQDVNAATTRSVWEQLGKPPLLKPSPLQEQLVREGHLGRKTERGVYDYGSKTPTPAVTIESHDIEWNDTLSQAVQEFIGSESDATGDRLSQYIFARIVAALIVQAHLARERGVATADDIDTALKYGVNYPRGPFEWTRQIGGDRVAALLEALNETVDDNRFAVPGSLRQAIGKR